MSKSLNFTLDFLSYEGEVSNNPEDSIKVINEIQESDISEVFRIQKKIADSTVDESINIPSSNNEYLIILCDQQVSMKLNGSSDSLTLTPRNTGNKSAVFYYKGDLTAISISNSSGSDANIDLIVVNS